MPAQLLALNDGPSILLDKPILLLGRDLECDIRLDSRKISRRHCCIAQVSEKLLIRDLGSTNGVRINGVRVVEGQIKSGDELMIGNFRYRVRWDPLTGPAEEPAKKAEKPRAVVVTGRQPSEDELLEACEDPVPLADRDALAAVPVGKAHGRAAEAPEPVLDVHAEAPPPRPAYEPIIPDEIELAPSSGEVPEPLSPPPLAKPNHLTGTPAVKAGSDSKESVEVPSP
jgi:predicted component of type VI protein secretion system